MSSSTAGSLLAEKVVIGVIREESSGVAAFLIGAVRKNTSHVRQIGHCARARAGMRRHVCVQVTHVYVLAPESADIHSECGAVLDGGNCVSCKL